MLTRIHIPNGVDFAYLDAGSGPAVVLVHGHPLDHTMWQPQIDLRSISSIFS
jgi:pimeloyl-ACP methyl ester carboxylesterase